MADGSGLIGWQAIPFIQAKHFHPGRLDDIRWIVLHDMEAARSIRTAKNVAAWFAGPDAPEASCHYCIDPVEIVQCVGDGDTAWGAPGANACGLHLELAGFAKDTAAQWEAQVAIDELKLAAQVVAHLAKAYDIPLTFLWFGDLLVPGARGITTHAQVTRAMKTPGGHVDPGGGFPIDDFFALVLDAAAA